MNLLTKYKGIFNWPPESQKKSDFLALPGLNAKKSRREILLEITNSFYQELFYLQAIIKETHIISGMRDSNSRPLGPKPSTLAIWANPRSLLQADDFIIICHPKSRAFSKSILTKNICCFIILTKSTTYVVLYNQYILNFNN